ncbi:MAG: class I SAM-dependent methyltransferase [Rubrobacter sp.]
MAYSDPGYVTRQYRDASNLEARIALHERFSTNPYGLPRWIFDHFGLQDETNVLEVGCGPGRLWTENLDRLPKRWGITLTDASPGMVREAERNLSGFSRRFELREADVQELPFESERFDAVIANHMLYHVPNRPRALSEISRVLKPGGVLYAATNGERTQSEMGWMQRILDPSRTAEGYFRDPLGFSLENGAEQLSPWFSDVTLRRYEDTLAVTEVEPLVEYLLSGSAADAALQECSADEFGLRVSDLAGRLEQELDSQGMIRITKDTGLFIARK